MTLEQYAKQNGFNPDDIPYYIDEDLHYIPIVKMILDWEKKYGKKYPRKRRHK